MKVINRIVLTACGLLAAGALMDGAFNSGIVIREAAAIIGRPATPVSGAGTARRTTRRVIRRSSVYAATLPVGYTTVVVEGATLYYYGGTYYQPYNGQYVVVYVD
jgi:hypothetical protein